MVSSTFGGETLGNCYIVKERLMTSESDKDSYICSKNFSYRSSRSVVELKTTEDALFIDENDYWRFLLHLIYESTIVYIRYSGSKVMTKSKLKLYRFYWSKGHKLSKKNCFTTFWYVRISERSDCSLLKLNRFKFGLSRKLYL